MTLNITLASYRGIHQSSDLRLTSFDSPKVIDDSSPKQIHIIEGSSKSQPGWNAVISYCGMGKWRDRDTCDWMTDWVNHTNGA